MEARELTILLQTSRVCMPVSEEEGGVGVGWKVE